MVKDGEKIDLFDTIMNIDEQFDDQNLLQGVNAWSEPRYIPI